MKRILSLFFISTILSVNCFAQDNRMVNTNIQQSASVAYQEHSINMPTYIAKGAYTYMFDRFGTLLGYFRKTPSGKVVAYDNFGNKKASTSKLSVVI